MGLDYISIIYFCGVYIPLDFCRFSELLFNLILCVNPLLSVGKTEFLDRFRLVFDKYSQ